jgi:hypothetical protein
VAKNSVSFSNHVVAPKVLRCAKKEDVMIKLFIALLLLSTTSAIAAEKGGTLAGVYGYFGDTCYENLKDKDCAISIQITGPAAQEIYNRMTAKAKPEGCTNGLIKDDESGMICYKVEGKYNCDFGYSFSKRKMQGSDFDC